MASAAAELFVKVSADVKGLTSGFKGATDAAKDLGKDINRAAGNWVDSTGRMRDASGKFAASARGVGEAAGGMGAALEGAGKQASIFGDVFKGALVGGLAAQAVGSAIGFMTGQLNGAVKSLMNVERTNAQTVNVIRSMGGAANVSAQEVMNFANALEQTTGIAAENIQQGQNLLLTFGNIKNGVGESNKIFDQASKLMVDLSAAMGSDAKSAAIQLGKALNDPTQGVTALTRVGVSFTDGQKATIKSLQESGKLMEAQKIILGELEKQFGGSAEAAGKTLPGALARLDNGIQAVMKNAMGPGIPILTLAIGKAADAAFGLANAMMSPGGVAQAIGEAFGPRTQALILGFGAALSVTAIPAVVRLTASVQALALAFVPLLIPMAKFLALAGAIAIAAYPIIKNWDAVKHATGAVFQAIINWHVKAYNVAVDVFSGMQRVAAVALKGIASGLKMIPGIGEALGTGFEEKVAAAGAALGAFRKMVSVNLGAAASTVTGLASRMRDSVSSLASSFTKDLSAGVGKGFAAITPQIQAAGNAAKKTAEDKKQLAAALTEASQKAGIYYQAFGRIFSLYAQQASAAKGLVEALKAVDEQAAARGRSFDIAGGRAKAYSDNIKAIESSFGVMSRQAIAAREAMQAFSQASADGGAVTASAFGVIDEASKNLETQAVIAKALGKDYDALGESIKSAEGVLTSLIEKGLKPGNKAYDEAAKKLAEVRKGLEKKVASVGDLTKGMGDLFSQTSSLLGQLKILTDAFGVEGASAAIQFAQAGIQVGSALAAIPGIIAGIGSALTALSALFVTNPILAAILAIVGAVAIVGGAMYAWYQSTQEESRKAAEEMRKIEEEALRIRATLESSIASGIKSAAREFLNGTASWGEALRGNMRNGLIDGVIDALVSQSLVKGLADLFEAVKKNATDPMSAAFKDSVKALEKGLTEQLQRLEPALVAVRGVVNEVLPAATKKMDEDRQKVAAAAAGAVRASVDQGSRAAVERYLRAQMDAMDRFRNMGLGPGTYEYEVARDQAEAAARQLRGMATGGLVTGPTIARMGEGGRSEAVLPLNDNVYRQLGEGIAAARGGGSGVVVNVNYSGNGKWTREDAAGLGRLMVAELRALGVR